MKEIDNMIRWYEEHETRQEYTVIKAKLKLIKSMYEMLENAEDKLFMDEIIKNFSNIVELQREVILDKEMELTGLSAGGVYTQNYIACPQQIGELREDKQMQAAFTDYLTRHAKKPLSSYTINDYCSRIRNLWKSFYKAYRDGQLPQELCVEEEKIMPENPLMNAYHHIDELNCYVGIMSANSDEKKNWANAGAALNKFIEFVNNAGTN